LRLGLLCTSLGYSKEIRFQIVDTSFVHANKFESPMEPAVQKMIYDSGHLWG
jgi:hypothetical protein